MNADFFAKFQELAKGKFEESYERLQEAIEKAKGEKKDEIDIFEIAEIIYMDGMRVGAELGADMGVEMGIEYGRQLERGEESNGNQ